MWWWSPQWETRGGDVIWYGLIISWWRHEERNNDDEITMRNLWWRCDMIWPDDMMVTAWWVKWWRGDYNEKLVVTMWYYMAWWYDGDGMRREIMTRRLQWETCGDDVIWYGLMIWWWRHEGRNDGEITMRNLWWRCDMIWPDDMMVTAWGVKWWRGDYNKKLVVTMWYGMAWWYDGDGMRRKIMMMRLQWETCGNDVIWYGLMIWWWRHEEWNDGEITMKNLWWWCGMIWPDDMTVTAWGEK